VKRNRIRLGSPDREHYGGKYPREAKVKKCKIPLPLFVKEGEKKEHRKSNVTADYLQRKVCGLLLPQLCKRTELSRPSGNYSK
jgi:hypothetical protein